jgi:N utilization substance protein B
MAPSSDRQGVVGKPGSQDSAQERDQAHARRRGRKRRRDVTDHGPSRRARRRALQALYQWQLTGHAPDDIIDQFYEAQDFQSVDRELFETLVRGVVERQEELAVALQPLLDRPLERCEVTERVTLLIGAYHLLHLPELPWQVSLAESVDLANRFGSTQGHAFVNAVLERAARAWGRVAADADSAPSAPWTNSN